MRAEYEVRAPRESDLPAIAAAVNAAAFAHDHAATARTPEEFRREWDELDPHRDAWIVTGAEGEVAGYARVIGELERGHILADAYTHPDHLHAGIGTALLTHMEARAAELAAAAGAARVVLINHVMADGSAARMLRARGYRMTRLHKRMRMALRGPLVRPVTPEGVLLRPCDGSPEDLRRIHACVDEAFGDRWGGGRRPYDRWAARVIPEDFDPELWLVAERAGRVLGASLGRLREVDGRVVGEISQLGVVRDARRLGVARALLLAGFVLFASRGAVWVGLDVDSESATGAHLLYEGSGMTTTSSVGRFEVKWSA